MGRLGWLAHPPRRSSSVFINCATDSSSAVPRSSAAAAAPPLGPWATRRAEPMPPTAGAGRQQPGLYGTRPGGEGAPGGAGAFWRRALLLMVKCRFVPLRCAPAWSASMCPQPAALGEASGTRHRSLACFMAACQCGTSKPQTGVLGLQHLAATFRWCCSAAARRGGSMSRG